MNDIFESEQRIESMIANGRKIMGEAIEQYKPIAVFGAFSGGNDSIVSTHFACTEFNADACNFDTKIGIDKTRQHTKSVCEKFGWRLHVNSPSVEGPPKKTTLDLSALPAGGWTNGKTAYEEAVFNFGFPGPSQHPRMYQRLKERALKKLMRETKRNQHRHSTVMIVSGIRHDESAIRAGYKRAVQKSDSVVWVNPFYFQTANDFELYRQEFGLPRNPVSSVVGISGECLCGAHASPGELERVRSIEPATAEYIDDLEVKAEQYGHCWRWGSGGPTKKQIDASRGQQFLIDDLRRNDSGFAPMCVGCSRKPIVASKS